MINKDDEAINEFKIKALVNEYRKAFQNSDTSKLEILDRQIDNIKYFNDYTTALDIYFMDASKGFPKSEKYLRDNWDKFFSEAS